MPITVAYPAGQTSARIWKDTITFNGTGFAANTQFILELARPEGDQTVLITTDGTGAFSYPLVPQMVGAIVANAYAVRGTLNRFGSFLGATANSQMDAPQVNIVGNTATVTAAASTFSN